MDLSLFLAQLFGLYFLLVGALVLLRRESLMPAVSELLKNRGLVLMFAFLELAGGLAIVIGHPIYTPDWQGLITLVGIMMVIESLVYLALPAKSMRNVMEKFNTITWYRIGALVAILIGGYLTMIGFGIGFPVV